MSDLQFPVGVFIEDELTARKWSVRKLASRMGRGDYARNLFAIEMLLAIVGSEYECKVEIDQKTAAGLGRAFGTSAQLWQRLGTYRQPGGMTR